MVDSAAMLAQLQNLVTNQEALRREITDQLSEVVSEEFSASALDGAVTATVTGLGSLRSIDFDILAKREYDNETLSDAVVEAVAGAEEAARNAKTERVFATPILQSLGDVVDLSRISRLLQR